MASSVGLLAIRPPSRNRPNARKYDGAAPLALAACQINCWHGGGGGERRFSVGKGNENLLLQSNEPKKFDSSAALTVRRYNAKNITGRRIIPEQMQIDWFPVGHDTGDH